MIDKHQTTKTGSQPNTANKLGNDLIIGTSGPSQTPKFLGLYLMEWLLMMAFVTVAVVAVLALFLRCVHV